MIYSVRRDRAFFRIERTIISTWKKRKKNCRSIDEQSADPRGSLRIRLRSAPRTIRRRIYYLTFDRRISRWLTYDKRAKQSPRKVFHQRSSCMEDDQCRREREKMSSSIWFVGVRLKSEEGKSLFSFDLNDWRRIASNRFSPIKWNRNGFLTWRISPIGATRREEKSWIPPGTMRDEEEEEKKKPEGIRSIWTGNF